MLPLGTFLPIVICSAALAAGAVQTFQTTGVVVPEPAFFAEPPPAASPGDRNCSDFSTPEAAQVFFEAAGPGDPHGLDRDGDGKACEHRGPGPGLPNPPDRDCIDFATWSEAQSFFEQSGDDDPHCLDADEDRLACESLMTRTERKAFAAQNVVSNRRRSCAGGGADGRFSVVSGR